MINFIDVCEGVEVLRFQEDRVARSETLAWYRGDVDPNRHLHSLTLCARFFLFTIHSRSTFFMLMNGRGEDGILEGDLWVNRVRIVMARHYNFQLLKEKLWAYRWHHLCFTYDHEKHLISTYVDGGLNNEQVYEVGLSIHGNGVRLGQGTQSQRSFSGQLTQVNVWDRTLSESEVRRVAQCEDDLQGNYISWNVGWTLENIISYQVALPDLCSGPSGLTYFWFPSLPFKTALYLCQALGSRLPSATDIREVKTLFGEAETKFNKTHSCYTDLWTAPTDREQEGTWKIGENTVQEDIVWTPNEPNGLQYENCVSIVPNGAWDVNCKTNKKCIACTFEDQQRFSLLGTCEDELRNVYFMVFQYSVNELIFMGYGAYQIRLEDGVWEW
ncbi:hypothetical protein Pcinc_036553, partial [Petrolisthes cinctipes]